MRKDIKQYNRITLTLFLVGIIFLNRVDGTLDKLTIFYSLTMALYYLASELFNFHLWSSSDSKRKEIETLIKKSEEMQHDTTRNDQLSD